MKSNDPVETDVTIEQLEDGPLLLKGAQSIVGPDGGTIECRPVTALCRCGASKNKPFCDGAHGESGFTSAQEDISARDKVFTYEGRKATIHYNRVLCSHAAECSSRLPSVFDPSKKPWVVPDNGSIEDLRDVVKACPSGALRLSVYGEAPEHLLETDSALTVERNGPYRVLHTPLEETRWATGATPEKYVLCRCGNSGNKPFCDGSHYDKKWRDA